MMIKLCFVFGTRPEAIKLAMLIREAQERSDVFEVRVCVTGQHREMLDQMLNLFQITPDVDLELMKGNQTLCDIAASTIRAVGHYLQRERPDYVIVQGDTSTVWTSAVAAFFNDISVAHVEAGLRTGDKKQPFPEEINRRIATQVADLHFAPTRWARENLLHEGLPDDRIFVTGNTVIDTLHWTLQIIQRDPPREVVAIQRWYKEHVGSRDVALITGHRRENFGVGFENICMAIAKLAERYSEIGWVYPVHLNPNVREPVHRLLHGLPNVHLLDPLGYTAFVWLMQQSRVILTDSGGVQEEAPSLGKTVLVMRDKTERPEGVDAGLVRLVGTRQEDIIRGCEHFLKSRSANPSFSAYGDGRASTRILDVLATVDLLGGNPHLGAMCGL